MTIRWSWEALLHQSTLAPNANRLRSLLTSYTWNTMTRTTWPSGRMMMSCSNLSSQEKAMKTFTSCSKISTLISSLVVLSLMKLSKIQSLVIMTSREHWLHHTPTSLTERDIHILMMTGMRSGRVVSTTTLRNSTKTPHISSLKSSLLEDWDRHSEVTSRMIYYWSRQPSWWSPLTVLCS